MRKIKLLSQINLFMFLYLNFFCRKVERKGKGYIVPYWHAVIELGRSSKIILHDQHLWVNYYKPRNSHAEAYIRMAEDTVLEVTGEAKLYYRSTVELKRGAKVTLGSTYLNCGTVLLAAESIAIGNDVAIAMDVMIYDSDHHPILDENGRQLNPPKPVIIKDHVWISRVEKQRKRVENVSIWQTNLITLYCAICNHHSTIEAIMQRQSNNFCPQFSDEE